MIALAGMIGTGLFLASGQALAQAGPLGCLLGYATVNHLRRNSVTIFLTCFLDGRRNCSSRSVQKSPMPLQHRSNMLNYRLYFGRNVSLQACQRRIYPPCHNLVGQEFRDYDWVSQI